MARGRTVDRGQVAVEWLALLVAIAAFAATLGLASEAVGQSVGEGVVKVPCAVAVWPWIKSV